MSLISEDGRLTEWAIQRLQKRGLSVEEWAGANAEVQTFVDQLFEDSLGLRSQLAFD